VINGKPTLRSRCTLLASQPPLRPQGKKRTLGNEADLLEDAATDQVANLLDGRVWAQVAARELSDIRFRHSLELAPVDDTHFGKLSLLSDVGR
jgi:hypothetical protein